MSRLVPVLCAALVAFAAAQAGGQAGPPKYSVGQRVEAVNAFTDGWQAGTVTRVDDQRAANGNLKYQVHLDRPVANGGESDLSFFENEVRLLVAFTPFKVGTRVDVYYEPGKGKGRGKVIGAPDASGRYKIHFDGCGKNFDERVDHTLVVKFTPSYPTYKLDGIIIRDSHGDPWKIYKRKAKGDRKAHMTAQRVCSGLTEIGTKV